ncbi:MAG: hypothetical protein ACUZ9M_00610 [Candidatus Scalindua sp.]
MGFTNNYLVTKSSPVFVARNEADENGATGAPDIFALATEGDFAQMPSTVLDLAKTDLFIPKEGQKFGVLVQNGLAFSFTGGSAAGKTFTYDIFTWTTRNGAAKHSVNGTGILGTQQVVKYPHNGEDAPNRFWADTLIVSWENHLKEVESTDTTGHNSFAEVWFDGTGIRYVFIQISGADGSTGDEAGNIAVFYRYF